MAVSDYFKPLSSWTSGQVREFLRNRNRDEYNLIDVRQPKEYAGGHLPGSQLIPLNELPDLVGNLDPQKVTIVYCAHGIRSRSAAAFLLNSGFSEVHSIEGGIKGWQGVMAEGPPEAGMAYFIAARNPEELIALAWLLEEGSRRFYDKVSERSQDKEAAALFYDLTAAEELHEASLCALYERFSGKACDSRFPWSVLEAEPAGDIMEGGMKVSEALQWAQGKGIKDILELAISLETNSYDLYLKMEREMTDESSKHVFRILSGEERDHLGRLTSLFENRL